jgi:hypothetical protein
MMMVVMVLAVLKRASIRVGLEAVEMGSFRHDVLALAAGTAAEEVRVRWGDEATGRDGNIKLNRLGLGHDGGEEGGSGEEDELHFLGWSDLE